MAKVTQENALMTMTMRTVTETTWIANLGATSRITNGPIDLYNIKYMETPVTLGDGSMVTATMNAKLKLKMEGKGLSWAHSMM